MDAFEFHKELRRICAKHSSCLECPMAAVKSNNHCQNFLTQSEDKLHEMIAIVEKWSKEHPVKTMAMDFFEKFPNAPKHRDGIPKCCPNVCGYCEDDCAKFSECGDCWNRPLEEYYE